MKGENHRTRSIISLALYLISGAVLLNAGILLVGGLGPIVEHVGGLYVMGGFFLALVGIFALLGGFLRWAASERRSNVLLGLTGITIVLFVLAYHSVSYLVDYQANLFFFIVLPVVLACVAIASLLGKLKVNGEGRLAPSNLR